MTQQDEGLRQLFGKALQTHMRADGRAYRFTPIETGSVASGVPDAIFETPHRAIWIEFKVYRLVGELTWDRAMQLLRPAQRGFFTMSAMLSREHWVLCRRTRVRFEEAEYLLVSARGAILRCTTLTQCCEAIRNHADK